MSAFKKCCDGMNNLARFSGEWSMKDKKESNVLVLQLLKVEEAANVMMQQAASNIIEAEIIKAEREKAEKKDSRRPRYTRPPPNALRHKPDAFGRHTHVSPTPCCLRPQQAAEERGCGGRA